VPILYGGLMEGVAPPPDAIARWIGTLALDQQPIAWVDEIIIPSTRLIDHASLVNRRRVTRIKEDAVPLVLEVRGVWLDDATLHFAAFSSAMLNQQQVAFNLGDGTEYRMVDVLDVVGTRLMGSERDRPGMEGSPWGYVAKVLSYEPYSRERAPVMSSAQALASGAGSTNTNFAVNYLGTAPGEPTWQWTLVVPAGVTVSQLQLANTLTGETCVVTVNLVGAGTFYVLMDASGADGGLTPKTPNNNGYGLLQTSTPGYGASVATGAGAAVDNDFSGNIPTLREARGQLVPVAVSNPMRATISATAALTTATLSWLAPTRYIRA